MQPVKFKGSNTVYAENQPEYLPLPAHRATDGCVTSCWALSWRERWRVLVTGRVFVAILTFNQPLQPVRVATTLDEVR